MNNEAFAMRLKKLREETGYSQKDFAKKLGIPSTTYNNYETGFREPDFDVLKELSKALNVSTDYLLGATDNTEPLALKEEHLPYSVEVIDLLEQAHKNPQLKILFSVSKNATKQQIEAMINMVRAFKGEDGNDNN